MTLVEFKQITKDKDLKALADQFIFAMVILQKWHTSFFANLEAHPIQLAAAMNTDVYDYMQLIEWDSLSFEEALVVALRSENHALISVVINLLQMLLAEIEDNLAPIVSKNLNSIFLKYLSD